MRPSAWANLWVWSAAKGPGSPRSNFLRTWTSRASGQPGVCSWSIRRLLVLSTIMLGQTLILWTRMVHTGFLRPSLIEHVNTPRIDRNLAEDQATWSPYPTHRDPRPSCLSESFDEACNLSTIARDISRSMFAESSSSAWGMPRQSRDELYERIRRWHDILPEAFDPRYKPPPHILLLRYVSADLKKGTSGRKRPH